MSDGWLDVDGAPLSALPAWAGEIPPADGVAFRDGGIVVVSGGRATAAKWDEVIAIFGADDAAYVMLPRRPPAPPWLRIDARTLGDDQPGAVQRFVERVRTRRQGGSYRDRVVERLRKLELPELSQRIFGRQPVPGALEVPSTVTFGASGGTLLSMAQAALIIGGLYGGLFVGPFLAIAAGMQELAALAMVATSGLATVAAVLAAKLLGKVYKRWRVESQPKQRVLVLAPDGCVAGFSTGVRVLPWSEISEIRATEWDGDGVRALAVVDASGREVGAIDERWLDAPLELVVDVAETYRKNAAR